MQGHVCSPVYHRLLREDYDLTPSVRAGKCPFRTSSRGFVPVTCHPLAPSSSVRLSRSGLGGGNESGASWCHPLETTQRQFSSASWRSIEDSDAVAACGDEGAALEGSVALGGADGEWLVAGGTGQDGVAEGVLVLAGTTRSSVISHTREAWSDAPATPRPTARMPHTNSQPNRLGERSASARSSWAAGVGATTTGSGSLGLFGTAAGGCEP